MVRISPKLDIDCDVLIAGAGPAGAATAAWLARRGYDVLLMDRQDFPRDKVCGDFVGPTAIKELVDLGVHELADYRSSNLIHHAALYLDGEELIDQPIPEVEGLPAFGRVIPRLQLDDWLFRAATSSGARAMLGQQVIDFEVHSDIVEVKLKGAKLPLRTRLLIGADGATSIIARILNGTNAPRSDKIIAVRGYYDGVEGPSDRCDLFFDQASFPGYYWLFPTAPGKANVGLGMILETQPPGERHLTDLLTELVARDKGLRARLGSAKLFDRIVGWPLTTFNARRALTGARVMLVGDAAGLINPLNGEGIQYAIASGRWASEAAAMALSQNDLSATALEPYARRVRSELGYDMALANWIVGAIRNRRLNHIWLMLLRTIVARARFDPDYAHIAGGILAGLVPAKEAVSSRMAAGTLQQALFTIGVGTIVNGWRSPEGFYGYGLRLAGDAFRVSADSMRDPRGTLAWAVALGVHTARLAGHVVNDRLRTSANPRPR